MSLKQELHLSYVLHARPYRETSLLLEILSAEHGRVGVVARGAKRGKAKDSSLLQPFMPLQISWFGNGELVTLTTVEASKPAHPLQGRNAICGLYVNELLIKLLPKWDPCEDLFVAYEQAIANLASDELAAQVILRRFELQLLKSMGYGLQLNAGLQQALNSGEFTDKAVLRALKNTIQAALQVHLGARKIVSRELL